ncbi:MAG: YncE family protein [Bacteroidia bacterium]|nr:YncE family protein [Bacteroidia bacterium]MCX7764026.1 YncE family protein [Bacteroidia bacterium]MDW8058110.1 YncE family protein [Bacteroidia bacterium]
MGRVSLLRGRMNSKDVEFDGNAYFGYVWRIIVGLILFTGCKKAPVPPLSQESQFPEAVARILIKRCAGCHTNMGGASNSPMHEEQASPVMPSTSMLNLTRWDSLFYGPSREVPIVIPGDVEWSHILWKVNPNPAWGPTSEPICPPPMPDSSNFLSREEIEVLRAWIAQGAPNAAGQRPWEERKRSCHRKAFVCASGSDVVAVFDLDTYHLLYQIPVGVRPGQIESPHYIQLSPDGKYFYVTLIAGAAVEKYRTDTYEKVGRVEVGADPAHIEFSSDGRYAVVTHFTDVAPIKLTLIDAERMQVLDELRDPLGQIIARPHGLWITPDFRYAYVTANAGNYLTKVEISQDRTRFVDFEQIPLAPSMVPQADPRWGPYQIIPEPTGQYYFVSCDASNEVRVFRQRDDSLVAVIPTAAAPKLMTYHEGLVYVACLKARAPALQGDKLGAVAVIDALNLRLLTHIYGTGHLPRGIGVDPVRKQLLLSFENLAGMDPPHHYVGGIPGMPAKLYVLQIPSFQIKAVREFALVGYGLAISP